MFDFSKSQAGELNGDMKGTTTTRIFKEGTNWSHLFHWAVFFFFSLYYLGLGFGGEEFERFLPLGPPLL